MKLWMIEKVNALKRLLEPVLYDLIDKLETVKDAINNLNIDDEEATWSDYYDDEIPPYYWGWVDCNENIF